MEGMAMSEKVEGRKRKKLSEMGSLTRIIVLVVLMVVISLINKNFLGAFNIGNLLADIGLLLTMGLGMTFVLVIGSIDLSLGSMVSCAAVIMALLLPRIGIGAYFVVAGFGLGAGWLNGFIFTKLKIPSFITTLGMMSIYTSLALVLSDSTPLQVSGESKALVSWVGTKFGVVPIIFVLAIIMLFVLWLVQSRTKFGKYTFAIGANEKAARMSGVRVDRNKILVFTLAGLCFAVAAIILTSKLKSGVPTVGDSYTLMAIAAVALGGTSMAGGKGGVLHTLLGTALSVVITNGMVVIGVEPYWQQIVYGIIIIVSIATTVDRKNRNLVVK